jgi:hypothetical protein
MSEPPREGNSAPPDVFDGLVAKAGIDAGLPTVRPRVAHVFERADIALEQNEEVEVGPAVSPQPSSNPAATPRPTRTQPSASTPSQQRKEQRTTAPALEPPAAAHDVIRELTTERLVSHVPSVLGEVHSAFTTHTERVVGAPVAAPTSEQNQLTSPRPLLVPSVVAQGARVPNAGSEPLRAGRSPARAERRVEPTVTVSIGRLEVTAVDSAPKPHSTRPEKSSPRVTLDDFLLSERAT